MIKGLTVKISQASRHHKLPFLSPLIELERANEAASHAKKLQK